MGDILSMVNQRDSMEGKFSLSQAVLPLEFYGPRRDTLESEPLRRLMSTMLIDAIRCFQTKFKRHQSGRRQEFAEVQSWLFSSRDEGPFSFRAVCDELEIDPEAVRRGLTRWAAEKIAGRKPPMIQHSSLPAKRSSGSDQLGQADARRFIRDARARAAWGDHERTCRWSSEESNLGRQQCEALQYRYPKD